MKTTDALKRPLVAELGRPSRRAENPWEGLLISDLHCKSTEFWYTFLDGAKPATETHTFSGNRADPEISLESPIGFTVAHVTTGGFLAARFVGLRFVSSEFRRADPL